MQITRTAHEGALKLSVTGRLDGYWADHLDNALAECVRDGHHHLRVDLAQVTFLSSAGIAALMKFYRQLTRINGSLTVLNPSTPVRLVLDMTRVSAALTAPVTAPSPASLETRSSRHIERSGIAFEVFDLPNSTGMSCRVFGSDAGLIASD